MNFQLLWVVFLLSVYSSLSYTRSVYKVKGLALSFLWREWKWNERECVMTLYLSEHAQLSQVLLNCSVVGQLWLSAFVFIEVSVYKCLLRFMMFECNKQFTEGHGEVEDNKFWWQPAPPCDFFLLFQKENLFQM